MSSRVRIRITIGAAFAVCLLLLGAGAARAQVSANLVAFSAPEGNALFFSTTQLLHPGAPQGEEGWIGYHIYRKGEGETSFTRITDRPVSRAATLLDGERISAHALDLAALSQQKSSREEVWELIERNDKKVVKLAIFNNELQEILGLLHRDDDVRDGVRYEYYATLVDLTGKESAPGKTSAVTHGAPDFAGLGPLDVKGQEDAGKVEISWAPNPDDRGALSYRIYRAADSNGYYQRISTRPIVIIGGDPATMRGAFTDTGLIDNRTYYYAVVSVDLVGNESRRVPVALTPHDIIPPLVPGPITTESAGLGIYLHWPMPEDAADLAGYDVLRGVHPDSTFVKINDAMVPANDTVYEDRSIGANAESFYRLVAYDRSGNASEPSAYAVGFFRNVRAPLPPQYVAVTGNRDGVRVTWERNEEEDLQGYYVYRAISLNGELEQVSPLIGADTTFFQDTSDALSARGTYWYLVQAINLTGAVSRFSIPTAATPDLIEKPLPPMSFHGYDESYGIRLFWSGLEDASVSGILIERAVDGGAPRWETLTREPLDPLLGLYTDSTAVADVRYIYRARAMNGRGMMGDPTQSIALGSARLPLLPPAGLSITPARTGGVALKWNAPFDDRVAGYVVYRKSGRDAPQKLTAAAIDATTFTDATAAKGTLYFYSVVAVTADGAESPEKAEMMYDMW